MDLLPTWTKGGSWTLGRDPLGMQATSVRIYRGLVPGLTNVTNRLRYYSFYCWVAQEYEASEHSGDEKRWGTFIRRAEALYALACNLVDLNQADGLAGNLWAQKLQKTIQGGTFDVRPVTDFRPGTKQYLAAKRGNFGQFYIRSMTEEKFLDPSEKIPIVSESLGRKAATAFCASVGKACEKMMDAVRNGTILIKHLREFGTTAHPSRIPDGSDEMLLLRDFVLAREDQTISGNARRSSAWLLLDLFTKGVLPEDEHSIRQAFYNRVLPDGSAYHPPGRTVDVWQAYQANELCHIALETILNAIVACLQRKPNGADPDALIGEVLKPIFADIGHNQNTWQGWATEIGAQNTGNEATLADPVLTALQDEQLAEDSTALHNALKLLATLWRRWLATDSGVRETIRLQAAKSGRSLDGVLATLETNAQDSALDALGKTVRRHVISDHLAIAGRKLASSGTFTYHFTSADGFIADGRLGRYGYTNPRLRNLVRFLQDAALLRKTSVTQVGKRFLNECSAV